MEYIVDFHGGRELQSVCLGTNSFGNRKRTKTFPIQLFRRVLGRDIRGGEPNFIANRELDTFVLGVIIAGLVVLCGLDILDLVGMVRSESFCESFGCGNRYRGGTEVDREPGMESVIGIKRRTIDRRLMRIVVRKLGKRQEGCPIVLLIVAIDSEVLLDSSE